MENRLKRKNIVLGLMLLAGLAGSAYEGLQYWQILQVNRALLTGKPVDGDDDQGQQQDYKHAVQTYGQLLEMTSSDAERSRIQFNLANNLFVSGLIRRVNDDGTLKDEARYAFSQARFSYEQALRSNPESRPAKFNLSLLHAVMPANMKGAEKDQSGMELSNLPIGLP
jgi:mxaK protein